MHLFSHNSCAWSLGTAQLGALLRPSQACSWVLPGLCSFMNLSSSQRSTRLLAEVISVGLRAAYFLSLSPGLSQVLRGGCHFPTTVAISQPLSKHGSLLLHIQEENLLHQSKMESHSRCAISRNSHPLTLATCCWLETIHRFFLTQGRIIERFGLSWRYFGVCPPPKLTS